MNREEIEHAAHERVHTHMEVGFIVLGVVAGLTVWRWVIYANTGGSISVVYLVVAFLALGLTMFQDISAAKLFSPTA